jgi:hypothetical protein
MWFRNCLVWILVGIGLFSSEAIAERIDVRSTFEPMERRLHAAYGWDRGRRSAKPAVSPEVGTTRTFWAYEWTASDDGDFYTVEATCRGVGEYAVIFVEDAQWDDRVVVPEDVEGLISAFDQATPGHPGDVVMEGQGIYERTTWAFGDPPDVDGDPKIYILLLDIRDFLEEEGAYVAGYFSGVNEYTDEEVEPYGYRSNETEMFYLDVNPGEVSSEGARRTLAHEFQHMIHFKQDPGEETWINEGCSTFAEWVSGYGMRLPVHFKDDPNNSLTDWGGRLVDYEQVGMFVAYLYEHWGGMGTIRALVAHPDSGTVGVTETLKEQGSGVAFDEVFRDWVVANYLDDEQVGDARYAYDLYDLTGSYKFEATKTYGTYPVGTVEDTVWYSAAKYLRFTGGERLQIAFDGADRNDFTVRMIALRDGADTRVETIPLDALNYGSWVAEDADEVILVPTIGPGVDVEASYRFSATEIEPVTVVEETGHVPERFALGQNFPNPFNGETVIAYELSRSAEVTLAVYDLSGQRIRRLFRSRRLPGTHTVRWDGRNEAGREVGSAGSISVVWRRQREHTQGRWS